MTYYFYTYRVEHTDGTVQIMTMKARHPAEALMEISNMVPPDAKLSSSPHTPMAPPLVIVHMNPKWAGFPA